ncbi:putative quinol monooxygenase [Oricola sp.]|uniref:putative quinol monooxygenase n=1 Tax=Oricola sp. TaxID=1979950 RepID=UPI003BAADC06
MDEERLPPGTVLLDGYIDVPAERRAAVAEALAEHVRLTLAEPGCRRFSVALCPNVPGRYLVSEAFVDRAAFDAHQTRAAASAWADVTQGIARNYEIRTIAADE